MRLFRAGIVLFLAHAAWAQPSGTAPPPMAADADPTFEVATIKPSQPDEERRVMVSGTHLVTDANSLVDLMMFAYGVHPAQIVDGPEWTRADKFDVVIQPDLPGRPSTAQMRSIVQKLLADRFRLTFHNAQRELPVYRLVIAKGGPKITPATQENRQSNTASAGFNPGKFVVGNATMAEFTSLMQRYIRMDRPVVDHTGITGKYDFKLNWTPDISQGDGTLSITAPDGKSDAPSFFTAMQEELGLKLEALKEPADVLVIDRVEKPSAN